MSRLGTWYALLYVPQSIQFYTDIHTVYLRALSFKQQDFKVIVNFVILYS